MRGIGGRAAVEIGPGGGDEGATAVRKDEHQLELTTTMRPTQDGEGAAFGWVPAPLHVRRLILQPEPAQRFARRRGW